METKGHALHNWMHVHMYLHIYIVGACRVAFSFSGNHEVIYYIGIIVQSFTAINWVQCEVLHVLVSLPVCTHVGHEGTD